MKIKYIITLATIFFTINVRSAATPTKEQVLKHIDYKIQCIKTNPHLAEKYSIEEILKEVEAYKDDVQELINISNDLKFGQLIKLPLAEYMKCDDWKSDIGNHSICVC